MIMVFSTSFLFAVRFELKELGIPVLSLPEALALKDHKGRILVELVMTGRPLTSPRISSGVVAVVSPYSGLSSLAFSLGVAAARGLDLPFIGLEERARTWDAVELLQGEIVAGGGLIPLLQNKPKSAIRLELGNSNNPVDEKAILMRSKILAETLMTFIGGRDGPLSSFT